MKTIHAMSSVVLFVLTSLSGEGITSKLWGENGELWRPGGRLPDFSYAGYRAGEQPIPDREAALKMEDFGAKGDGETDDSQAFIDAIAAAKGKVIHISAGKYLITRILRITTGGTVLRGDGPDKTVLYFPKPLNDIKPNWGKTTGGRRTSNYSWSGGMIQFSGSFQSATLAKVEAKASRGDTGLKLSSTGGLKVGQRVELIQRDTSENSLANYLYAGDPGDTRKLNGKTSISMILWIEGIKDNQVTFRPALRFDIRPEWRPQISRFEPTVQDAGLEELSIRFPVTAYKGHFTEVGHNGIAMSGVSDCWIRNVRIENADSGIFLRSRFCTLQEIVITSRRKGARGNTTGHHGIVMGGTDNLLRNFDFRTRFIHDVTVTSRSSHNVASSGKGVDLCFDHHRRAPYQNLYTDIDIGAGTRPWKCGGGGSLGKHCAARETFWNIRSKRPISLPPKRFAPAMLNFVGMQNRLPTQTGIQGVWHEGISPEDLRPANLHQAQLQKRLGIMKRKETQ